MTTDRGATLVELLVSLLVIALIAGVSPLAIRGSTGGTAAKVEDALAGTRRRAALTGAAVVGEAGERDTVLALPDGRFLDTRTWRPRP